jgi:F-type H+-transporting ATPase subunit delta
MSTLTTLARPYAKATFEVAHGRGQLGEWGAALDFAALVASDPRVRHLIGDPNVANESLAELFVSDKAADGFSGLLDLLIQNDRLTVLPEIARLYAELKDEAERTLKVTVRSAEALDDAYTQRLTEALGKRFGKTIALTCEVDAEMLGGAVIQAGDVVIDGSLKGKIARLAESLTN